MSVLKTERQRVLFFIPNLGGGGAERVLINLLKQMDRMHFEPHLAVFRLEGPHANSVPEDVQVTELGVSSLWTVAPKLARLIRRLRPDVVVATTGGGGVPTILAHRLARSRARLIVWERSVLVGSARTLKRTFLLNLKKLLWPRADLVTAVGTAVQDDIIEQIGRDRVKTEVLHSPILDENLERMSQADVEHPWFNEPTPIILCVARLLPVKDHYTLLRGIARLREEREARLVLLGDGPLRDDLAAQAERLGIASSIWFAGFVDNPFKYMRRSSLLALTSLQEGVPGVVVQAMACGLPVVGTDAPGGTRELIKHEQTGLLIPMRDPEAFRDAARRLLDDEELACRIGSQAREFVKRFEVKEATSAYERTLLPPGEQRPALAKT